MTNENDRERTEDTASCSQNSVTRWIVDLKQGNPEAARLLSDRYFERLVAAARQRLGNAPRRVADEEDVALSVFHRLCSGADQGKFPELQDRNDLWALLLTITKGKAADQLKHAARQKRGGGDVRGHSVFAYAAGGDPADFDHCIDDELTPEFLVQLDEEHQRLLALLRDDTHRRIAVWRMDGFSNQEMADRLEISVKSIERKLRNIREAWSQEAR